MHGVKVDKEAREGRGEEEEEEEKKKENAVRVMRAHVCPYTRTV